MTRHEISENFRKNVFSNLEKVSKDRHDGAYGPAEESFNRIAILWEAYWKCKGLEVPHTPTDVAMLMSLFKHAREIYKPDFENVLDGANYLCFAGGFEAANRIEKELLLYESQTDDDEEEAEAEEAETEEKAIKWVERKAIKMKKSITDKKGI